MARTIAFFSYTRRDDRASGGLISTVRRELETQVSVRIGRDIEIFQDVDDIIGGDDWRARIEKALEEAVLLIAVISPSFFNSEPCREELARFLRKAERDGRGGLVLPVVFIDTPVLGEEETRAHDDLVAAIERTQWIDWRPHNHKHEMDAELRSAVIRLAELVVSRLTELSKPRPEPAQQFSEAPARFATPQPEPQAGSDAQHTAAEQQPPMVSNPQAAADQQGPSEPSRPWMWKSTLALLSEHGLSEVSYC